MQRNWPEIMNLHKVFVWITTLVCTAITIMAAASPAFVVNDFFGLPSFSVAVNGETRFLVALSFGLDVAVAGLGWYTIFGGTIAARRSFLVANALNCGYVLFVGARYLGFGYVFKTTTPLVVLFLLDAYLLAKPEQ